MAYKYQYKQQNKTVRVVCLNCEKQDNITLYGFPGEYRDMVQKEKCRHCGITGKLATNELAKARPRKDTSKQIKIRWN